MDKRKQIGFLYTFDKGWLGGLYYAQNLILALRRLPDEEIPTVNVYCYKEESFIKLKEATNYPYLKMNLIRKNRFKVLLRMFLMLFSPKWACNINVVYVDNDDIFLFPYRWGSQTKKLLYWMPDFQDKYYPELFSKKERFVRNLAIKNSCQRNIPIVFSSYDSQNDFKKFFPQYSHHKTYVLHFAVSQPDFSNLDINAIKDKYHIQGQYLFCANQFWQHKNHLFLFKAYKLAVDRGLDLKLVCTGNFNDNRNPLYIKSVLNFIEENHLGNNILLLGIIDKKEMLLLMKKSYAVVQPSLFEGWNTTVEDCKKMGKYIFLSDLKVHKEQISHNVCFFDPHDQNDLATKLLSIKPFEERVDYDESVTNFAKGFCQIIDDFEIKQSNKL